MDVNAESYAGGRVNYHREDHPPSAHRKWAEVACACRPVCMQGPELADTGGCSRSNGWQSISSKYSGP